MQSQAGRMDKCKGIGVDLQLVKPARSPVPGGNSRASLSTLHYLPSGAPCAGRFPPHFAQASTQFAIQRFVRWHLV